MEQPVKIIVSSLALHKSLIDLQLYSRSEHEYIRIDVSKGELKIGDIILYVEHNRPGWMEIRVQRLRYLRKILEKIQESPVVLIIRGDTLFLSEIYI